MRRRHQDDRRRASRHARCYLRGASRPATDPDTDHAAALRWDRLMYPAPRRKADAQAEAPRAE